MAGRTAVRRYSLRRRLLTLLLASVVVAWAATTLLTYNHAHHELDELLDAHLARSARLLLAQEGDELEEIRIGESVDAGPYGQEVVLQVWRDGRVLVLRVSRETLERALASPDAMTGAAGARCSGV
jgi:two-component system sensor histidine kinase QseC